MTRKEDENRGAGRAGAPWWRGSVRLGLAALAALALTSIALGAASCSLIVDSDADQCTTNEQCTQFPGRECSAGVCLPAACTTHAGCASFAGTTCSEGACVPAKCAADADCTKFPGTTCQSEVCAPPTVECSKDEDCSAKPGTICKDNACVAKTECAVNADCDAKGDYYICRKDKGVCVQLTSQLCTTVEGDYHDDNAFIFGSVLPTQGDDQATGQGIENGAKLAMADFASISDGIPARPPSTSRRPLVLVGCNDNGDSDTAVVAAQHLVNDVGVSAIIGGAYSGITLKIANKVTIPAGVLLFSPSATSAAITDLEDNGLVWRTSPSDELQGAALSLYMKELETRVHETVMGDLKVAILHKSDAYGEGLATAIESQVKFNGGETANQQKDKGNYLRRAYGDPDNPQVNPPDYANTVVEALAFKPHVAYIIGTSEGVNDIMGAMETQWTEPSYRPYYVFGDGGLLPEDLTKVIGNDAKGLRKRISGSVPGTNNTLFQAFKTKYSSKYSMAKPEIFGVAGGYDIVYLLAYAATAIGDKAPTGPNLVEGLKKMVPPGPTVEVGQTQINSTFPKLKAGNIDFNGASGPLDFDVEKGEAPSDIQLWCVSTSPSNTTPNSGLYYDAVTQKLTGMFGAQCQ